MFIEKGELRPVRASEGPRYRCWNRLSAGRRPPKSSVSPAASWESERYRVGFLRTLAAGRGKRRQHRGSHALVSVENKEADT